MKRLTVFVGLICMAASVASIWVGNNMTTFAIANGVGLSSMLIIELTARRKQERLARRDLA